MDAFKQIVEFNQQIIKIEPRPLGLLSLDEMTFTCRAVNEEMEELRQAHNAGDVIGSVDALLDSIYFAVGGLYKLGLTAEQMEKCMDAVHKSNMTKVRGTTARGHENDAVKPEGWVAPEEAIGMVLDEGVAK